jgi:hypothetical protein
MKDVDNVVYLEDYKCEKARKRILEQLKRDGLITRVPIEEKEAPPAVVLDIVKGDEHE